MSEGNTFGMLLGTRSGGTRSSTVKCEKQNKYLPFWLGIHMLCSCWDLVSCFQWCPDLLGFNYCYSDLANDRHLP